MHAADEDGKTQVSARDLGASGEGRAHSRAQHSSSSTLAVRICAGRAGSGWLLAGCRVACMRVEAVVVAMLVWGRWRRGGGGAAIGMGQCWECVCVVVCVGGMWGVLRGQVVEVAACK